MLNQLRFILALLFFFSATLPSIADEGMWIPLLIKAQEGKMQGLGMEMSAEDIYSETQPSLKDAIVHFGGGCTASIISSEGLILTNHHCGYSRIQSHSSVEKNYLDEGFWAMDKGQELTNPGLTASIIVRIEDITEGVMAGLTKKMTSEERAKMIDDNGKKIGDAAIADSHYDYQVKSYYNGNKYYLIVRETFRDVRLVGAPPSSIGKFGFDTDNWVWPRHTGDFSLFRIYAGPDNKPADIATENKPYVPKKHVEISLKGLDTGDFTMVYGFPGTTYEYLISDQMDYYVNKSNPMRIKMRDASLAIIDEAMRKSDLVKIQYASKQSRISNAWKKWKGQTIGLQRFDAVEKTEALEKAFVEALAKNKKLKKKYGHLLPDFKNAMQEWEKYDLARALYIEMVYYGPEFIRFVDGLKNEVVKEGEVADKKVALQKRADAFYKNYEPKVDIKLMAKMTALYFDMLEDDLEPTALKAVIDGDYEGYAQKVFGESVFLSKEKIDQWIDGFDGELLPVVEDPALVFTEAIMNGYSEKVNPKRTELNPAIETYEAQWMTALLKVLPDYKDYYPDANGTLRVAYGNVNGYEPADAIRYFHYTTAQGILEKEDPDSYEYSVPEKLITLIKNKDYGDYAQDGELRICFLAGNHTSGGNSGSPAFNAKGQLVGLNFDRTWESTMSDMMYNPEICRNIMVDLHYVLFIVDKFAGAKHLVDEMSVIK